MTHRIDLVAVPSAGRIDSMKEEYAATLSGPLEPYIEEQISYGGTAREILCDGEPAGYCVISGKKVLLQFYVRPDRMACAEEAFAHLVSHSLIDKALVLTRDPLCLSLALDLKKSVTVRCHLFSDEGDIPASSPAFAGTSFRAAGVGDIPAIRAACGDFHDFLHYTLEGSIERGEIFVLYSGTEVLGTGVISGQDSQPPYVDIGMCVNEHRRKQGVGTHIVTKLREHCRARGWIPGASCQSANTASKKTLEKAGMASRDRVLEIVF